MHLFWFYTYNKCGILEETVDTVVNLTLVLNFPL